MRRVKLMVLVGGLLVCGALGVVAAVAWSPEASVTEGAVERVRHGVTETGRVEAVTTEGQVRRVIRWKTRQGGVETQTVEGPLRLRIRGSTYFARPEGPVSPSLHSMRLPEGIMTLPTTTVIQTVTETVQNTTTVIETVTVTTETGTTETGTTETGTSTSP